MSAATKEVATDVATDMLGQAAKMGMKVNEEAVEAMREAAQEPAPEPEAPVLDLPTPAPTAVEETVEDLAAAAGEKFVELPKFAPVPEEEFLGFEEEETEQTIADLKEVLNTDEEGFLEMEDADDLRAKIAKLEKALNFQKELRAKTQRSTWEKEAKERYPLANISDISAQSRNAFMKAAAKSHNQNYDHLSPYFQQLEEAAKQAREQAKAEGKKEAVEAWGEVPSAPTVGDIDEGAYQAGLAEARKTRKLENVIRYMREHGRGPRA